MLSQTSVIIDFYIFLNTSMSAKKRKAHLTVSDYSILYTLATLKEFLARSQPYPQPTPHQELWLPY